MKHLHDAFGFTVIGVLFTFEVALITEFQLEWIHLAFKKNFIVNA